MRQRCWALLLSLLLLLAPATAYMEETVTFTDDLGQTITVSSPKRVAALSGSFAEIWLLAGGTLCCATQDAWDERALPLSADVVNVGSLKQPSAELLLEQDADFALLTPALEGQRALGETLAAAGVTTVYFEVETFADYLRMLDCCTRVTGRPDLYGEYGERVAQEITKIVNACQGKPSPSVLLLRAYSTGVKAKNSQNNMVGAMLDELGCRNIADSETGLLETLSMETIITEDPDFIFITTMGADDEALSYLAKNLQSSPAWQELTAVREGRCHVLPKALFHYKPNARWAESYQMLADFLYGQ